MCIRDSINMVEYRLSTCQVGRLTGNVLECYNDSERHLIMIMRLRSPSASGHRVCAPGTKDAARAAQRVVDEAQEQALRGDRFWHGLRVRGVENLETVKDIVADMPRRRAVSLSMWDFNLGNDAGIPPATLPR